MICETSDIFRLTLPFVRVLVDGASGDEAGHEGRESFYNRNAVGPRVFTFSRKSAERNVERFRSRSLQTRLALHSDRSPPITTRTRWRCSSVRDSQFINNYAGWEGCGATGKGAVPSGK